MDLGKRIKARREELNLSQDELAKILGYKSRSTINKIEVGRNDITQHKIVAFAKALQTTPAYLMGWVDNENAEIKKNDILTDIVLKLQSDDEFREITETIYNASPELLNALKAFIFAFKQ